MAVNETIVTGRKFRKLTDAASKKWQRISFWHKASDCEFNDGKTAEEKLGAIKGITTDLNVTVPGYAADATRVSELNNSLNGCSLEQEGTEFFIVGADSVRKKLGNSVNKLTIKVTDYLHVVNGVAGSYAVAEIYTDDIKILTVTTNQQNSDNTSGRWQPVTKTGNYTFN